MEATDKQDRQLWLKWTSNARICFYIVEIVERVWAEWMYYLPATLKMGNIINNFFKVSCLACKW